MWDGKDGDFGAGGPGVHAALPPFLITPAKSWRRNKRYQSLSRFHSWAYEQEEEFTHDMVCVSENV